MTKRNNATRKASVSGFAMMPDPEGYLKRMKVSVDKLKLEEFLANRALPVVCPGEELNANRRIKILSVGCADAHFEIALAIKHPEVDFVCIDLEHSFIVRARREARKLGLKNIRFECISMFKLVERVERFDVVWFGSVIHEFYTYGNGFSTVIKAFTHAHELLNVGGLIVIRDMMLPESTKTSSWLVKSIREKMLAKIKPEIVAEFVEQFRARHPSYADLSSIYALNHLLLKYMYEDNWPRELKEDYVAVTINRAVRTLEDLDMKVQKVEHYLLDFLAGLWTKDFGFTPEELRMFASTTWIVALKDCNKPREPWTG